MAGVIGLLILVVAFATCFAARKWLQERRSRHPSIFVCSRYLVTHLLSSIANIYGFVIILVHIVNKRQVIIRESIRWIKLSANFEVLHTLCILLFFEICETQIVMQLRVLTV